MDTLESKRIIAELEENGYSIIRNVIDGELVAEMSEHLEWLTRRYPDLRPEHLHHPLMKNDAFWVRVVTDPRLVDIVELVLGPDIACFTSHYICKPPHDGHPVLWHQDGAYWKLDPMKALTVWLAVDETTPENGCLQVIPGSHRLALHVPEVNTEIDNMLYSQARQSMVDEWAEKSGIVHIQLQPGDVSIHDPHVLHCSAANRSPNRRCGLDIGYMPASTSVSNNGLYLDPILVRGQPDARSNSYSAYPRCREAHTISFRGSEQWDRQADELNRRHDLREDLSGHSPLDAAQTMIRRLKEGSVKY